MSADEHQRLTSLRELALHTGDDENESFDYNLQDIEDGRIQLDISHAGGEYKELTKAYRDSATNSTP